MPCLPFDAMPDTARLWIFPATRPLSAPEAERVLAETDAFIAGWAAHGAADRGTRPPPRAVSDGGGGRSRGGGVGLLH